jgi:type VI secretion system secreted protein VgrG
MPDPDDPTSASPVSPAKPTDAQEADASEAGQVEEVSATARQTKAGKYGSQKIKTHTKNEENKEKTHWIEIELVDDAGQPVPGEDIDVECPDGSVASGTTDDKGKTRIENLDPGSCKITFVNLDKDAWEPA